MGYDQHDQSHENSNKSVTTGRSPLAGLRVLAVSPVPTHPATAGNRVRPLALLDRLERLGAIVRLVRIKHEPGDVDMMKVH